jgi:hypothetical protein
VTMKNSIVTHLKPWNRYVKQRLVTMVTMVPGSGPCACVRMCAYMCSIGIIVTIVTHGCFRQWLPGVGWVTMLKTIVTHRHPSSPELQLSGRNAPKVIVLATRGPQTTESDEQIALAQRLDAAGIVWFSVPNGGKRGRREAGRLVREGVKAGVPDLIVLTPAAGAPRGVALELKRAPPGGTLRDVRAEQWAWLARFEAVGFVAVVGLGCADSVRRLQQLGYEVRS